MAQITEIALLVERKRFLAAESEVLRRRLGAQLEPLEELGSWVDRGWALARSFRAIWPVAAAAAGYAAARKGGGFWRILRRAWTAWKVARPVLDIWRELRREDSSKAKQG